MRAKNRIIASLSVVLLGLLLFTNQAKATENIFNLVEHANTEYENAHYHLAITLYKKAIHTEANNGHIYYDLANAQYRLKQYGHAIANYRRALEQYPRDPDIKANLNLAREHTVDKMNSNKNSITSMINILAPASLLSNYERHLLFFIIYFLFWISLALWFLKRTPYTQTLSISMLMVCIYTGLLAFGVGEDFDGSPTLAITPSDRSISNAVIINEEVKVYSGNSETFQVVFLIHDGAEIKTGEVRGKWVQVFLPEKQQGWLKKNTLDIL